VNERLNENTFPGLGKWVIAGIVFSFLVGTLLFLTIAQQRSGDPIPPEPSSPSSAAPAS
jgi:hypothetical protein